MTKAEKARMAELKTMLAPKQLIFCEQYYANSFRGAEAILKAGYRTKYPEKMAWELINKKPLVKEYLDLMEKERAEKSSLSVDYVVKKLIKNVDRAEADNNLSVAMRGLELLARHLGMFIDRQEITGKDGEAIQLQKVENDAADFTRSIVSIATRGGKASSTSGTTH